MADDGRIVELDEELAESVRAFAAAKGIPFETVVRDALQAHMFAEMEWSDDPDLAIDERILDDAIRNGRTIPWSEIRPWVESWGKSDELPPPKWRK